MSIESIASFASRCSLWLGTITPEIRAMPDLPATQPGALVASAQGGALMLFATGQPTVDDAGAETYSGAEIWIGDGVEGDLAPIWALQMVARPSVLPDLIAEEEALGLPNY